jgi:hypothetical protein
MRSIAVLGVLMTFGLFCTGCVYPKPERGDMLAVPNTQGRICDSRTGKPIEGASVMIDDRPETMVLTDAEGRFHVQEIRKTYFVVFMSPGGAEGYLPSTGHIYGELSVHHPTYQDLRVRIREHLDWNPSNTNFDGPLFMSNLLLVPKE